MEFSHELALALVHSSEPFPVDFDDAWQWIGYSSKQMARKKLVNNFENQVDFLIKGLKSSTGGRSCELIVLTVDCLKSLGMMAGTLKGKEIRRYFLECERIANKAVKIIPVQNQEIERMRLELELIRAKQHYQDTGHAIALSTSPAMLQWLRGEAPPPKEIEVRDRFVDPTTGQEVGSSSGRSLTQLIADAGLNPNSKRDRQLIKKILKSNGFDYDRGQRWVSASYLREYPVLEEELYQQALKVVLAELGESNSQPNLFVHSLQQASLKPSNTRRSLQGEEP